MTDPKFIKLTELHQRLKNIGVEISYTGLYKQIKKSYEGEPLKVKKILGTIYINEALAMEIIRGEGL